MVGELTIRKETKEEPIRLDGTVIKDEIREIEKETGLSKQSKTFTEMSVNELSGQLDKFMQAVEIIKKKMIPGVHYLEIHGVEKPIITKQGTA